MKGNIHTRFDRSLRSSPVHRIAHRDRQTALNNAHRAAMHQPSPKALSLVLLLCRDHLERGGAILLVLSRRHALGDLAPAAAVPSRVALAFTTTSAGAGAAAASRDSRGIVRRDHTFIYELPTADELVGKAVSIESVGGAVNGIGQKLWLSWELKQVGREIVD